MSDSEYEQEESLSEPEDEELSHMVKSKSASAYQQLGGAFDTDNVDADVSDEDADPYEKPKIKIGEQIDNVTDSDDDDEDADALSVQDSDNDSVNTIDLKQSNDNSTASFESDDEDIDEDYLKRFDKELVNKHINLYHPESSVHNYDEVRALSRVTKDRNGIINDDNHKTLSFLTKFEKSKILGLLHLI